MMQLFEIKNYLDLTWADIPLVEDPVFAENHLLKMLTYPHDQWNRVINIREFEIKEIGTYDPLFNHDYAASRINYLLHSGQYFSVCRSGRPVSPAFVWKEDQNHPHKGMWVDSGFAYLTAGNTIKNLLARITHHWYTRKTQAFMDNLLQSPFALAQAKVEEYLAVPKMTKSEANTVKTFSVPKSENSAKTVTPNKNNVQPLTFNLGDTGKEVKNGQMIMLSYGLEQPVVGRVGEQTLKNQTEFNGLIAAGNLPLQKKGINPTKEEVDTYLAEISEQEGVPLKAAKAVLAIESSGGKQFNAEGLPLINPSHNSSAVGMMQLTEGARKSVLNQRGKPLYSYQEISYDWKKNIEVGIKYYGSLYSDAAGVTERERAVQAYQMYHDGPYAKSNTAGIREKYAGKYDEIK